jgi:hypothetical protein
MGETGGVIPQSAPVTGPTAPTKLPGRAGIWIGVVLVIAGIVLGIVLIVNGARTLFDAAGDLQRLPVTGGTVAIDEPGSVSVYAERPDVGSETSFSTGTTSTPVPEIAVLVTGPDGGQVSVDGRSGTETYAWDGRAGTLIAEFRADAAGTYELRTVLGDQIAPFDALAVGDAIDIGGVVGIVGGVLGGGVVVVIGIIVIIVSAVRRSRAKRQQQPPTWGYGPPGGWPAAPAGAPAAPWASGPGWAPPPVPTPGAGYGPTWSPPAPPPPASTPGWVPPPPPPSSAPPGSSPYPDGPPPAGSGPVS